MAGGPLPLDACVLINLLATSCLEEIAADGGWTFIVVPDVAAEAFFLRDEEAPESRRQVNLEDHISRGVLIVEQLHDNELDAFVAHAARVDPGEAATIALAAARGLPMATDDKAALRLVAELGAPGPIQTTASLLRRWAATADADRVAAALRAVETRASFVPGRHDAEASWWQKAARHPAEAD